MKAFKYRDKHVQLLKAELAKIYSRSATLLNIRRSVRKANKYLNEVVDFIERYDSDLLAVKSVKVKNIYLARALQNERERSNRMLQEKIEIQSAYHDALREKAELRKENWDLEQHIISDSEDFKNVLPTIVELSEHYTKRILKYDALRKSISAKKSTDSLPPRSFSNISFGNNSNQPVSAVNPMVKGCVIQKPTINVRRVPFPNETRNSMFEYVSVNSPILEESEENISPANNLTARRCENGLRNALNVSSRRRVHNPEPPNSHAETYCEPSTAQDNQESMRLEPVVRLEDVTRLLQHSSIRISETPNATPDRRSTHLRDIVNEHWSPEVLVPKISTPIRSSINAAENALEGSSWMYQRGPSVNIPGDRSQSMSTIQNNSSCYQSRVPFTPDCVRTSLENNCQKANVQSAELTLASEAHLQSACKKRKFFQSCKSPSTPRSPLSIPRDSGKPIESLQEADFYSDLQNDEGAEIVSSSNVDETAVPLGRITQRRRKGPAQFRLSSLSSNMDENGSQNSVERNRGRHSVRLRRSVRESTNSTGSAEDKSSPKKSARRRKQTLNDSNISISNLDNSSQQSRSTRNRSNVSYKEPTLNKKMRRD